MSRRTSYLRLIKAYRKVSGTNFSATATGRSGCDCRCGRPVTESSLIRPILVPNQHETPRRATDLGFSRKPRDGTGTGASNKQRSVTSFSSPVFQSSSSGMFWSTSLKTWSSRLMSWTGHQQSMPRRKGRVNGCVCSAAHHAPVYARYRGGSMQTMSRHSQQALVVLLAICALPLWAQPGPETTEEAQLGLWLHIKKFLTASHIETRPIATG